MDLWLVGPRFNSPCFVNNWPVSLQPIAISKKFLFNSQYLHACSFQQVSFDTNKVIYLSIHLFLFNMRAISLQWSFSSQSSRLNYFQDLLLQKNYYLADII